MALQPASGARDLLPRDVGVNRWIAEQLAAVYQRWGYEEVTPPSLERIDTLEAGGAIQSHQVVQVVADEALGLRPEMTASIARAACTRLAAMQRPLRLHYRGSTFQAQRAEDQGLRIVEDLQSGVELMGAKGLAGDAELLRLLLDAGSHLPLSAEHQPTLLIGHQRLLSVLLEAVEPSLRSTVRRHVCELNRVALSQLELPGQQRLQLLQLLQLRGEPAAVLNGLEALLGETGLLAELKELISIIEEQASHAGIRLQLDPTFHPDFELYDGVMVKLVCQGLDAPVAIASGGRYDALVQRFSPVGAVASGVGFSFAVEAVRQLLEQADQLPPRLDGQLVLVAYSQPSQLHAALNLLEQLHQSGQPAELWPEPCANQDEAQGIATQRGVQTVRWVG
ncbi:ATP-phosphoribosyltransferase/ regulatory subunit [Synechococcus sp. Minos11]|uniref:ATP phosphoribosyltransferase regulatory subunit n=1 Tax=Synechococcus sp. Minos11 TaxID=221341 RepID=UPI0016491E05|nr:ATP phosphoribosyltransferase regulatory subunit [Synechococcus sp. Minos11]QNJ08940.1 ATP-phosphoribosyltransferase/ regulatory subunit [Synechococcus sp. Minos11]